MESVSKTSNDDRGLARCYHAMGDLYRDLRANPGEAASFFEKSLSYAERVGDVHLLFSGHAEAAQTHLLSGSDIQVADEHARVGAESHLGAIPVQCSYDGMVWYVLLDSDTGELASCGSTIRR